MTYRALPHADALVEIEIPVDENANRRITRRIATVRDHGGNRFTCLLSDPDTGKLETVTIVPSTSGQWVCVQPPVSIDGAVHIARAVAAGITLHRSVTEQMRVMANAILVLTGNQPGAGPLVAARVEEIPP